ncbi:MULTISPECIES: hypothetical protein [unclassified Pseudofrankia]|nr:MULTISPECIES: hypothetical protein [unclassified Pseudofrankia]MDT3446645.1 hypothetical protein [Pseudofrankia sp. BMG5.37]OHV55971.1 hypothetical protein BCD48_44120 [Pseudofrankia sp. BMG5.36]
MVLASEALNRNANASKKATERARAAGETRPAALYAAGAKAYLMDIWKTREISRVMLGDDGPPGYANVYREAGVKFMHGARGLTFGNPPLPNLTACAVTALVHAGALQIVEADGRGTATKIADYFTDLILRLANSEE